MEALLAVRCLGVALACAAGFALLRWCRTSRRPGYPGAGCVLGADGASGAVERPAGVGLLWRMRSGVGPLLPLSRRLLRLRGCRLLARRMAAELGARQVPTSEEACLSAVLAALAAIALVVVAATGSPLAGAAVMACAAACAVQVAKGREEARLEALREAVPEALQSLSACFQSGLTVAQAFERQAKELPPALGRLFGEAASQIQVGGGVHGALEHLRRASDLPELSFVAVALDVQHQTGGSMRAILESSSVAVEEQLELKRSLRVQTAQARLSARVVTALPFVLVALFSVVSEGFLEPFFTSLAGMALLCVAIALQAAGVLCVRRMLAVDLS